MFVLRRFPIGSGKIRPLVYLQNSHDNNAWSNPAFQTLMLNAIKWAGLREAMTWARANPKVIFS